MLNRRGSTLTLIFSLLNQELRRAGTKKADWLRGFATNQLMRKEKVEARADARASNRRLPSLA
jgi:hypothetical protein